MLKQRVLKPILFTAMLFSAQSYADLVVNGSFELAPQAPSLTFGGQEPSLTFGDLSTIGTGRSWAVFSELPGWSTFYGPGIEVQYNGTLGSLPQHNAVDGNYYAELDSHFNIKFPGNSNAGIYQRISDLVIGKEYQVSFFYRARTETPGSSGLNLYWGSGDVSLDRSSPVGSYDYNLMDNNHTNWVNYTKRLTATSTEMLLGFGAYGSHPYPGGDANGDGKGAFLDQVSLTEVSSPAVAAVLGFFMIGVAALRRKKTQLAK